tara:strand:+ start:735 stop:1592 length:858 start_codon:yes stop_codon:yes gene_type:complete
MKVKFNLVPSYNFKKNKYLNNSIYFMHVPKSGGTTIDHIFAKLSHILKNFDFHRIKYNKNNYKERLLPFDFKKQKPKFISGHLNYDFCDDIKNCFKFTIVREPIQRIISNYKFTLHNNRKDPSEFPFEYFIKNEVENFRDNLITRQFSGQYSSGKPISRKALDIAIQNINYFDMVNTLENWDIFLSNILSKFELPSVLYSRYQEHNYNFSFIPTKENLNLLKKYYGLDYDLYKKISKKETNQSYKYRNDNLEKICIVSPYLKSENKLFSKEELSRLFKSNDKLDL